MNEVLVGTVLGIMGGLFGVGLCFESHKRTIGRACLIIALMEAVVSVVFWRLGEIRDIGTVLAVIIPTLILLKYRSFSQAELARLAASASALRDFVQRRFRELDVDGDGSITRLDLCEVREHCRFDEQELVLIRQLDRHLSMIGHVVDSMTSMMPTGMVAHYAMHGVSLSDVQQWPAKAAKEYANRFAD